MNIVIDRLTEVLAASPGTVLSANSIGAKKPSNTNEIPAIVASLSIESSEGIGMGNFIRSGDTVVKSTNVIVVNSHPDTFSSNLKSLRLWPLPLKKNPSSTGKDFSENDVRLRNVTDLTQPIDYRMVDEPTQKNEYMLDVPNARVIFGESQTQGEKLEVVHWTITWRDEILGERYRGSMALEIWADNPDKATEISQKLQNKIKSDPSMLRNRGFLKFAPERLEPLENIELNPTIGSPFSVWKQKLGYKFIFEAEQGGEVSSGTIIKRIDLDMNKNLPESFSVPK
ncbi:MAG: hypothetical protein JSV88_27250 [Candidatus Aminicenantes bacterium]|nr:MAG: hypothetical protein JSV88_27250 [Candidatus Aminicenantes bacterium]